MIDGCTPENGFSGKKTASNINNNKCDNTVEEMNTGSLESVGIIIENDLQTDEGTVTSTLPLVIRDLQRFLKRGRGSNEKTSTGTPGVTINDDGDNDEDYDDDMHLLDKNATAVPVAAIESLLGVVQRSTAETMMGLQDELKTASDIIIQYHSQTFTTATTTTTTNTTGSNRIRHCNIIALQSGCELFLRYVTRTYLEVSDFDECKNNILVRGEQFRQISVRARDRIAAVGSDFIPAGGVILTHGLSRVVASIIQYAKQYQNKNFDLIILEGQPDCAGLKAAKYYSSKLNIPVTVIPDNALGWVMEQIDIVLVGAEGVMENGGIVNKIGTYAMACAAKATASKPFYVAVESYKFTRLYPFSQQDIPSPTRFSPTNTLSQISFVDTTVVPVKGIPPTLSNSMADSKSSIVPIDDQEASSIKNTTTSTTYLPTISYDASKIQVLNPTVDYTPSNFITLLFTDLGVLTPSAVSDELIRLYQ
jgi:translation initiation factor eIF-2B subunit alpha